MPTVLVVDDMALYRSVIARAIDGDPDLTLIGKAANGTTAVQAIRDQQPDLVTLDLEMPDMGGLEVLQALADEPPPRFPKIVVFSSLSAEGADITIRALRMGAADFLLKPTAAQGVQTIEEELIPRLRSLAGLDRTSAAAPSPPVDTSVANDGRSYRLLVIASSTGGPPALEQALAAFPSDFPAPVLIVQHMPPMFTASMAKNLDRCSGLQVAEAVDGASLQPGRAYVAKGGYHLLVDDSDDVPRITLEQGERIFGLRPAADATLQSLAGCATIAARDILLAVFTGMGSDGANGAAPLRDRGMTVLSQTEASCVVYGMPRAVDEAGLSCAHFVPDDFYATMRERKWMW